MALIILKETYTFKTGDTYRQVLMQFNTATLQVEQSTNEDYVSAEAPQNYSRPTAEEFHYTCSGTTKTGYYHNGNGGFTTTPQPNSAACGYVAPVPPADGTFLRTECYGVNLYNVVADGNWGERQGELVEANSAQCGYTPPVYGCTDPTADNYNGAAGITHDQDLCIYSPKVFTEVKIIEVLGCTDGVCLRWYNNLGGVDTWHFTGKVDKPFSAEATGEYSLTNGLKAAASKAGNPSMVLRTAGLNYNRYQALWQLYTSPKVWIHHPDNTTEEVYVQPATVAPMPLGRKSYDLTVEVVKAPINSLRN